MPGVPYIFGPMPTGTPIPLSDLDANFNTPVTIGSTPVGLGNTVTGLDSVIIGGSTPAAGHFTSVSASSGVTVPSGVGAGYGISVGQPTSGANINLGIGAGGIAYYVNTSLPGSTNENFFVGQIQNGGYGIIIYSNGNVINLNNSYGGISDRKLKQDIAPAGSQIENVKALSKIVSKFHLKSDPDGPLQIGLIADEVLQICPGLVRSTEDYEVGEDGTKKALGTQTQHVLYSIIPLQLLKALGELIERVETLENKS